MPGLAVRPCAKGLRHQHPEQQHRAAGWAPPSTAPSATAPAPDRRENRSLPPAVAAGRPPPTTPSAASRQRKNPGCPAIAGRRIPNPNTGPARPQSNRFSGVSRRTSRSPAAPQPSRLAGSYLCTFERLRRRRHCMPPCMLRVAKRHASSAVPRTSASPGKFRSLHHIPTRRVTLAAERLITLNIRSYCSSSATR